MSATRTHPGQQQHVRIIGGVWRGRKLAFTPAQGLRPTGDRIRETLFNWLTPHVTGARCADLFAGSGALGLEALSRGARYCDFVDTSNAALTHIKGHLATLRAQDNGHCHSGTAEQFLQRVDSPYDIVFVDPPFDSQLVGSISTALGREGLLSPEALIYIEMAAAEPLPQMPQQWSLYRDKVSGSVAYRLFKNR
jgi:16S rRNA (guanine966-N2)-methyltransferase